VSTINVGLIGIVGAEAKEDFWGTMAQVAAIGYRGIEGAEGLLSLDGDPADNLKRFHDLGLKVLTVSAGRETLRDDLPGLIRRAKTLESPRASVWWAPCDSIEAIRRDADLYNAAGATLAAEGITLCYHNHDHEFKNVFHGVYALDWLLSLTDPTAVAFELDVAWIAAGGEDPAKVLRRTKGRVPAIHVKDFADPADRTSFTTVGTGGVDVAGAVRAAIEIGIEWAVVEQDRLRNLSALETATVSFLNLKERGLTA
jgi:sugar phosphate isomerase/epimerase